MFDTLDRVTTLDPGTAFGSPRRFFNNRFVYLVLSQRARGLSIGVNLNPNRYCNFRCVYCEVNRDKPVLDWNVDIAVMETELESMLNLVRQGKVAELPAFANVPSHLLQLKEIALSGDGEPTLSPQFAEILSSVIALRARSHSPFFKIVLITNASGFNSSKVCEAVSTLSPRDELWVKLDAGAPDYMHKINGPEANLRDVIENILTIARARPVVIQSLFPMLNGTEPSTEDIAAYVERLQELIAAGAQIASVQVYSAHRPPHRSDCGHLRLATLSKIARSVRSATGLKAEVF